jgi:hypothetical protein
MATVQSKPTGNAPETNFFKNSIANRLALVPAAGVLASYANKRKGEGSAAQYNSLVKATQDNGAGPAIPPITAPFSFTQFATGKRILTSAIRKRFNL